MNISQSQTVSNVYKLIEAKLNCHKKRLQINVYNLFLKSLMLSVSYVYKLIEAKLNCHEKRLQRNVYNLFLKTLILLVAVVVLDLRIKTSTKAPDSCHSGCYLRLHFTSLASP